MEWTAVVLSVWDPVPSLRRESPRRHKDSPDDSQGGQGFTDLTLITCRPGPRFSGTRRRRTDTLDLVRGRGEVRGQ